MERTSKSQNPNFKNLLISVWTMVISRKIAKKANKEQKVMLQEQEKREKLRLAEAESEIGRRKAVRQGGGRSMLLAPQTQMGSQTIGG